MPEQESKKTRELYGLDDKGNDPQAQPGYIPPDSAGGGCGRAALILLILAPALVVGLLILAVGLLIGTCFS